MSSRRTCIRWRRSGRRSSPGRPVSLARHSPPPPDWRGWHVHIASKLPDIGTTIFTVMSRRARELGALNLGQGFPDYDIDPRITQLVTAAMVAGYNQYAPMEGSAELRTQIAR